MKVRYAGLLNGTIDGMPIAYFQEKDEYTESLSTRCFKDKHEALLEISIFLHESIFRRMASEEGS